MNLQNLKKIRVNVVDVKWEGEELAPAYYVTLGVNKDIQSDGIYYRVKEYLNTRHPKSRVKSFTIKEVQDVQGGA